MAIDHQTRIGLQKVLVDYMAGRTRTFAFGDQNANFQLSSDKSLQLISDFLNSLHDDFVDHPVSVSPDHWSALLRIVAFFGTELEIGTTTEKTSWPFPDDEEWHANESRLNEFDLPDYDISVHYRPVNLWWNRIPLSVGFRVVGSIVAGVIATLFIL